MNTSGEVEEEVQGGLISPVHVLDDDETRLRIGRVAKRTEHGSEDLLPRGALGPHPRWKSRQELSQWRQGRWSRGPIAVGDRQEHLTLHLRRKGADERRLAHASLAGQVDQTTLSVGCLPEMGLEGPQVVVPLHERHRSMVEAAQCGDLANPDRHRPWARGQSA